MVRRRRPVQSVRMSVISKTRPELGSLNLMVFSTPGTNRHVTVCVAVACLPPNAARSVVLTLKICARTVAYTFQSFAAEL